MKKKASRSKKAEIAIYAICLLVGLTGLALIICGIVGTHLGVQMDDNPIASTEATLIGATGIGYRWWGVIILLAAAAVSAIAMSSFARKEDRDEERNARRRERMQILNEEEGISTETAGAVETASAPVEEKAEPAPEPEAKAEPEPEPHKA